MILKKIIKQYFFFCTCFAFFLSLTSCASQTSSVTDTENLSDLQALTLQNVDALKPQVSTIRLQALKETALTIGAQGGLAVGSKKIDAMLEKNADYLDRIYNFNGLMLDHNVLPPVLEESQRTMTLNSPDLILASDHTYKIVKQACFVTAIPSWRDYIWFDFKKPDLPDATLLPKDDDERKIWVQYVTEGWQHGLDQADTIYRNGLARLQRDYKGMMLYRSLLAKNMVSKPYVAQSTLGTTSNSENTELQINNRLLRITAVPRLEANAKKWKPVMIQK